ncbi:hypothetical protein GCK72_020672 [Caenorhabditis remanei]|uniref:CUB-like domain-containing protein n=1 Tax=Caenorhabditis remanei TaxID=31234 RepID=A0A6A5GH74_CAERE|nr:hypothetical protein GCK72_020672 [Caenorhabditis remanei]KAF1754114.1 hypothetical protein GCK72_020672 [Caenorhabditis remanei]
MRQLLWMIVFSAAIRASSALDCVQIPPDQIRPLHGVKIPAGANETVEIPPNWSCTYSITTPPMMMARVYLENGLKGNNDRITVVDQQATKTLVTGRSSWWIPFYVFPNTTTTFNVVTKSVNMHSKFRLDIFYQQLPDPEVTYLGNSSLKYFMLNDLKGTQYNAPQMMIGTEPISLAIARSGWEYDVFDNYFVVDGDFQNPKYVYRMSRFKYTDYISVTNKLTVVGLDNRVSESSVVFSPLSQTQQFDSLTAIGTYFEANQLDIDGKNGNKKSSAVTVIGMQNYTRILSFDRSYEPDCILKAVEAPPRSSSEVFYDFTTITSLPGNITHKSFSIIAENCSASFRMVSLD